MPSRSRPAVAGMLVFVFLVAGCSRESAPPSAPAASKPEAAAPAAFELDRVPLAKTELPPFPVIDWPAELPEGSRTVQRHESERMSVIAGRTLVERTGRLEERQFPLRDAKLDAKSYRANIEERMQAWGAVKVNAIEANDPKLLGAYDNDTNKFNERLRFPSFVFDGYDAYAVRTRDRLVWVVVATNVDGYGYLRVLEEVAPPPKAARLPGGFDENGLRKGSAT